MTLDPTPRPRPCACRTTGLPAGSCPTDSGLDSGSSRPPEAEGGTSLSSSSREATESPSTPARSGFSGRRRSRLVWSERSAADDVRAGVAFVLFLGGSTVILGFSLAFYLIPDRSSFEPGRVAFGLLAALVALVVSGWLCVSLARRPRGERVFAIYYPKKGRLAEAFDKARNVRGYAVFPSRPEAERLVEAYPADAGLVVVEGFVEILSPPVRNAPRR